MKWLLLATFIAILGFGVAYKYKPTKKIVPAKNSSHSFALLELFTSEGCSSCPSADRLLPQLATLDSNIITLSYHVDYWDNLGWKDKFSNSAFTDRQTDYGRQFHLEGIYTPQLVINGQYELVGSNRSTAEADIKEALKNKPGLQLTFNEVIKGKGNVSVDCRVDGDFKDQIIFLALVQKHAETDVKAGENRGVKLTHTNIVRQLIKKPAQSKMNFDVSVDQDISTDNWQFIVFSQDKKNLKITSAAVYNPGMK
jgi:hypothetical protein